MTAAGSRPGPGRRPKTTREAIADAVIEIGFDDATVKLVAEHLGVSVAGLYHHVRGRDDLLRIASERLLAEDRLPPFRGQPWPAWLAEVATYMRSRLGAHTELITQYLGGAATPEGVTHLEGALETLGRFGFTPAQALDAFQGIGQQALGAAVDDLRERQLIATGRATIGLLHGAVAADPDHLRCLGALLATNEVGTVDRFDQRIELVLRGIADARGEAWSDAVAAAPSDSRAV